MKLQEQLHRIQEMMGVLKEDTNEGFLSDLYSYFKPKNRYEGDNETEEEKRKFTCQDCGEYDYDMYMVNNDVWNEFGVDDNTLCLSCLKNRMESQGRPLTKDDFSEYSHTKANLHNPEVKKILYESFITTNKLITEGKKTKESIKTFIEFNGLLKAIETFDSIDNVAKLTESTPLDLFIDYFQPPYVDGEKLIFKTGKEFSIRDFPISYGSYDFNFKIHSLDAGNNFWNFDIDILEGGTVEIDGEERELWDSDLWEEEYWWEIQNEINGILYDTLWLFGPKDLRDIGIGFNLE